MVLRNVSSRLCVLPLIAAGVFSAAANGTARGDEDGPLLFSFSVSYDAPQNATNVSNWLHRPAGKHGFVRADGGHLATDVGPIRFWATNLCFDACFPSHEEARRVAARMARLGINCVRMHHMDSHSIWGDSRDHLTIDPARLDRLDYLIYQLKRHGIYTNLNLHVSRWFGEREGFAAKDGRPHCDKGLDNFEPRMIELQKRYARDLLTHVNPYTWAAYTREPAIAMVEINNENALLAVWARGQLDDLPQPYATTFRKLWNKWLREKYGDTSRLAKAWDGGRLPRGPELIRNGDFSRPLKRSWILERDSQCKVNWSIQSGRVGTGRKRQPFLRIVVTKSGAVAWRPQLVNAGFPVKDEKPYTLAFRMRASEERQIRAGCMMAHEPWQALGLSKAIDVEPRWKQYRLCFVASGDDENARINFTGLKPGTYELADVSLRRGGLVGLRSGERLENDSVGVMQHGRLCHTQAARRDFVDFLWQTEHDYWLEMYRFLKKDLGLRPPVSGTQRGYGPVFPQAKLDYIDSHAYWQHPHFPGRDWDMNNWTVRNTAMVNEPGGTLTRLAAWRIWSMPYTVSEYNHPEPNFYAAEGFPMIAAFGRFQDWDGVFSFAYSHRAEIDPKRIEGFFDIRGNTARIVHAPACAAMFLRGDVQTARKTLLARVTPKMERAAIYKDLNGWGLGTDRFGLGRLMPLVHGVGLKLVAEATGGGVVPAGKDTTPISQQSAIKKDQKIFVSDTGELRWDVSQEGAGFFTVDTPRTKIFTGFGRGRTFTMGDVRLALGKTRRDWATVSMVCLDAGGFGRPGRILIAATGLVQNRGAKPRRVGDSRVTLGADWGAGPVMCEGVEAVVTLPVAADRVRFYPLDESGSRRASAPVGNIDGRAKLQLGPRHKTLWYEAEIR